MLDEVIEVKRLDDRMMKIAMVCGRKILHVYSVSAVYAPQLGRPVQRGKDGVS